MPKLVASAAVSALLASGHVAASSVHVVDPTLDDDVAHGYTVGWKWVNSQTRAVFCCFDATAGAAVWRMQAVLNASGVLEGPILARESTINDVPLDAELVRARGTMAIGDGDTIAGVRMATREHNLRKTDFSVLKRPGAVLMMSTVASGNITVNATTGGTQYAVNWWNGTAGTRTLHNSTVAATFACTNNAGKRIEIYPATEGQALSSVTATTAITGIDISGCAGLTTLTLAGSLFLDASSAQNLTSIEHSSGVLDLDVSECEKLTTLRVYDTSSKVWDLSNCPNFTECNMSGSNSDTLQRVLFHPNAVLCRIVVKSNVMTALVANRWPEANGNSLILACPALTTLDMGNVFLNGYGGNLDLSNLSLTSLRAVGAVVIFTGKGTYGIDISNNDLTASSLNLFFNDLTDLVTVDPGTVLAQVSTMNIAGNPGAATCNRAIAEAKGYTVNYV